MTVTICLCLECACLFRSRSVNNGMLVTFTSEEVGTLDACGLIGTQVRKDGDASACPIRGHFLLSPAPVMWRSNLTEEVLGECRFWRLLLAPFVMGVEK